MHTMFIRIVNNAPFALILWSKPWYLVFLSYDESMKLNDSGPNHVFGYHFRLFTPTYEIYLLLPTL